MRELTQFPTKPSFMLFSGVSLSLPVVNMKLLTVGKLLLDS